MDVDEKGALVPTKLRRAGTASAQLRLLATTDVHMQLVGQDYITDTPLSHAGLAGIATLIDAARAEATAKGAATLLVDNGDFVQGTALGSWAAREPVTPAHPVAATLNLMGYDAVGLGNHDLDFGTRYLRGLARHLDMPMISSNLSGAGLKPIQKSALVDCALSGPDAGTLRVGILSVLPAETAAWNRHVLGDTAEVHPAEACLIEAIPALRARGADLIVLLAHMGIEPADLTEAHRHNNALSLARLPGIDAIVTGHTHERFPIKGHPSAATNIDIDAQNGTLALRPASMPGYAASDLAVIDLDLCRDKEGVWHVVKHLSRLRRNDGSAPASPRIVAACAPAHDATRAYLATSVAQIDAPMHNFFTFAAPTTTTALVARAKAMAVARALKGDAAEALPLVASASSHTAGGREGPDHFLHIPNGDVLRRHISGLDPYNNDVRATRITGSDLRAILEHAARAFGTLRYQNADQMLANPVLPSFDFDTIFGVEYTLDPSQPVGQRVRSLTLNGVPVEACQPFVLATNQFRLAGGGGYPSAATEHILPIAPVSLTKALIEALQSPDEMIWKNPLPWHFANTEPLNAIMHTTPRARAFLDDIAHLAPRDLGLDTDGFLRLQLTL